MSMLAEPRRRSKYSTDPRGLNWSQDDDKFGQKMLEKMGWSKGKGLGANEDGRAEHVKVSLKSDQRGVGCSKSQADNWIAHQDDFNSLLANLNQVNSSDKVETSKNQVISLEEKSKSSKGRVHYMKFTKGKDLSSRKNEELDCIFGRRKSKSAPSSPQTVSQSNSPASSDVENEKPNAETDEKKKHGVITITNTLSVSDYFAKKMKEIKAKRTEMRLNSENKNENEEESQFGERVGFGIRKCETEPANLSHLSFSSQEFSASCQSTMPEENNCVVQSDEEGKKRKKKKKKEKVIKTETVENKPVTFNIGGDGERSEELEPPKKKKKKEKEINCITQTRESKVGELEMPKKKKKRDKKFTVDLKNKDCEIKETIKEDRMETENIDNASISKKRKREKDVDENCVVDDGVEKAKCDSTLTKKKKKKKKIQIQLDQNVANEKDAAQNGISSVSSPTNEGKEDEVEVLNVSSSKNKKKRIKKVKKDSGQKVVKDSVTSIATEAEQGMTLEVSSSVTTSISCEKKKRKKPKKDAKKLVEKLIVSTNDSNVNSETVENKMQEENGSNLKSVTVDNKTKVEHVESSDNPKPKKRKTKQKKKLVKDNGLIKIDGEKVQSNPELSEKVEIGFEGSNLGQIIGYGGGVTLKRIKSKN